MNTPSQQAKLYRKAAKTIEMCAPHGIEPMMKICGVPFILEQKRLVNNIESCEWPITVIEGHLVWDDTVVYDRYGNGLRGLAAIGSSLGPFTLTPPKRTVMVELDIDDAEYLANKCAYERYSSIGDSCRAAIDNLKSA